MSASTPVATTKVMFSGLASFNKLRIVPLNTLNEGIISRARPPILTNTPAC